MRVDSRDTEQNTESLDLALETSTLVLKKALWEPWLCED